MRYLFLSSLLALGLTATSQVPDHVPTDGLVAWYPFNGNASDESGNGNDGEVAGATIAADHLGGQSAFHFNGNGDQINIPHSPELTPAEQVTVSVWCNAETLEGKNLVSSGTHVNITQRSFYVWGPDEMGQCRFRINAGGVEEDVFSSASFGTSEWIHVIGTYDGAHMKLYVNGQLEGELDKSGLMNQHGYGTTIGGNIFYAWSDYWFQGRIDDVGIWSRALSEEEVFTLHNAISPITGCTDEQACNYNPDANVNDGSCYSCDIPAAHCGEGTFWDAESQSCVIANPSDTDFDGCVSMTDLLDLLTVFGTCNEVPWSCGDPLEYQGYDYETVQVGEQCWFAENLRAEFYLNGDAIPTDLSDTLWSSASQGALAKNPTPEYAWQGASAYVISGPLYNWFAVDEVRGICPSGWHVPDDIEWEELAMSLGGSSEAGQKMKAVEGWNPDCYFANVDPCQLEGTNESGFNGVPAGYRNYLGEFISLGLGALWWSATADPQPNFRNIEFDSNELGSNSFDAHSGHSVRCIQDSE